MEFVFVETLLETAGLCNPMLEVLQPDTDPYHAVLYQHKGVLNAQPTHFGNESQDTARNQFLGTIGLASTTNAALFASPEYSCPWAVIRSVLTNAAAQPRDRALWVLGCESISPAALRQFKNDFNDNVSVKIIFDETMMDKSGSFFDPLCYIFKTITNEGSGVVVCLVQFKTQHMGAREPIERNNYIRGQYIYIFRNGPESIYLFTLICSEAMVFNVSNEFIEQTGSRWSTTPYIILNIQLNPSPNHPEFLRFRKELLKYEKKEILTLNWAYESSIKLDEQVIPLSKFSGSGIYTDADRIDFMKDNDFIHNHQNGLYYTFYKPHFHFFHLNGLKEIFHIQNPKPFQSNLVDPLKKRDGPRMLGCFEFTENFSTQSATSIDDGLISFMDMRGLPNTVLRGNALNFFQKERLISLSSGEIDPKEDGLWYKINRMKVCSVDENGVVCRLTFTHDREGNDVRTRLVDNLDTLNGIIQTLALLPQCLSFLNGNFTEVMFFQDAKGFHYNFNLVSADNQNKATGAFCGRADAAEAKRRFDKILKLFSDSDQQRTRVVVWYEPIRGTIKSIVPPKATIRDDYSADARSITK